MVTSDSRVTLRQCPRPSEAPIPRHHRKVTRTHMNHLDSCRSVTYSRTEILLRDVNPGVQETTGVDLTPSDETPSPPLRSFLSRSHTALHLHDTFPRNQGRCARREVNSDSSVTVESRTASLQPSSVVSDGGSPSSVRGIFLHVHVRPSVCVCRVRVCVVYCS